MTLKEFVCPTSVEIVGLENILEYEKILKNIYDGQMIVSKRVLSIDLNN